MQFWLKYHFSQNIIQAKLHLCCGFFFFFIGNFTRYIERFELQPLFYDIELMGVMLIIARIDWLTCKRKGCGWCFSSSTRWCVSRPAWFKTADRTWSVSEAEVRKELKKRMSGWAVVTNDEACRALPEMKDLCIAIQYTPGVCCFLWVPVVIYTPFFFDDVRCLQHSQFGLELMPTVLWISLMWSCSVSRHTEHQRLPTSLCGSKPFYFVWNM